jgi:RNA polymerase sigma-70 factor (ECF subfamily)
VPEVEATESGVETGAVVAAARAGDESAFAALAERYRPELQVHCYRMLGSFEEAEDLVQETFLRAWRKHASFQGRSTFRAWLYGIATNACLDVLGRRRRVAPSPDGGGPLTEISWLQPYPDHLLEGIAASDDEPETEVVAKETIELAFIAAIQLLPPKQRAVLVSRDVLGWSANETASLLGTSVAAVNSSLQRARATMRRHLPRRRLEWAADSDPSEAERALLQRYVDATERADTTELVELLREDALFSMPPEAEWQVGAEAIVAAWVEGGFGSASFGRFRCVATRVNRQPAVACYVRRPGETEFRPLALDVLRIEEGTIAEVIAFPLEPFLAALDLPPTI